MIADLLASRGEGGPDLLMPASSTRSCGGSGLPHVSTGARDPVDRPWGAALQEKQTYFNRLLTRTHQLPDRGDALPPDVRPVTDRSGGEGEARLVLDRD